MGSGDVPSGHLLGVELEALELTGRLATLLHVIVFQTGTNSDMAMHDWNELAAAMHVIQRAIGSQAAARAHPNLVRGLGRRIDPTVVTS